MAELTERNPTELSSDINTITAEINTYTGEEIFEIRRK